MGWHPIVGHLELTSDGAINQQHLRQSCSCDLEVSHGALSQYENLEFANIMGPSA